MRHQVVSTRDPRKGYHPRYAEAQRLPREYAPPSKPREGKYEDARYDPHASEKGQCH